MNKWEKQGRTANNLLDNFEEVDGETRTIKAKRSNKGAKIYQ